MSQHRLIPIPIPLYTRPNDEGEDKVGKDNERKGIAKNLERFLQKTYEFVFHGWASKVD